MWSPAQARWQAVLPTCDEERPVPRAWRAQHRPSHSRGPPTLPQVELETRVLLGRGEASAARGATAVSPASAIDGGRRRGDVLDLISSMRSPTVRLYSAVLTFALQGSMRAIIARTARICLPSRVK